MKILSNILFFSLLVINSCTFNPFIQDNLSNDDKIFAKKFINVLLKDDVTEAKSFFSEELQNTNTDWLPEILERMNQERVKNIKLVYQKIQSTDNPYRATMLYELEYSNYWLLDEVTIDKISGNYFISGLYNYPSNSSFENLTSFKLINKPFINYLMLAISICTIIFIVLALIICIKTRLKNKWIWTIFILLGFIKISFNWATGTFDYQIISLQLLGIGLTKFHPYGPWFLSTSIPVGAIIFLFKRKKISVPVDNDTEKKENFSVIG